MCQERKVIGFTESIGVINWKRSDRDREILKQARTVLNSVLLKVIQRLPTTQLQYYFKATGTRRNRNPQLEGGRERGSTLASVRGST